MSDQDLIGVMGARSADEHWPPDGVVPEGAPVDAHGYLDDDATMPHLLDALARDAELVVGHLNAPDTAGHVLGPDGARDVYRATDARLAAIREVLEARDDPTITIIVSDHSMEPVVERRPVDLSDALEGSGLTWFPEGSAAMVYGEHEDLGRLLTDVEGIDGVRQLAPDLHVVWGEQGRWLCFAGIDGEAGMHGSPRTASQLAAVVGTHPAVRDSTSASRHPASTRRRGPASCASCWSCADRGRAQVNRARCLRASSRARGPGGASCGTSCPGREGPRATG